MWYSLFACTKRVAHHVPYWYQSLLCALVAVALSRPISMFGP